MKSYRSLLLLAAAAAGAVLIARAGWVPGADDAVAGSALTAALFRSMGLPDGMVVHSRPPWEAKRHVTELIDKTPRDADLYQLRAREDELLQDYTGAEADWKAAAANSTNKIEVQTALANFYAWRNSPEQEIAALLELGALPEEPTQRLYPASPEPQWKAFENARNVANDFQLTPTEHAAIYQAWIRRYPKEVEPYRAYFDWLLQRKQMTEAKALAVRMNAAFPRERALALSTSASLARARGGEAAALAVYDRNFSPLWPGELRKQYFADLSEAHQLRVFLADAQQRAAQFPTSLAPVERLFFYYEQQDRKEVAGQQLLALAARRAAAKTDWSAGEWRACAELFARVNDWDEAAHSYYQLYNLPAATAADKEFAIGKLIGLLLDVPEQPMQFGTRDLSLYRNIGTMDRHPGFLNGILSLVLNDTFPAEQYGTASQSAQPYFHRASASRLLAMMQQRSPHARELPALEAKLFNAYSVYGQNAALMRYVPAWLRVHAGSPSYVDTALLLADAYSATHSTKAELALYDSLLSELAARSGHLPIGAYDSSGRTAPRPTRVLRVQPELSLSADSSPAGSSSSARSPDYVRVLDRYISRLVQLRRPLEAVALLRRETDRNPDDPGIYERLALFLEQNQLDADLEQTYRRAFGQFKDTSWASKLARFYLREKKASDYEALTRQITDTFKGSTVAPFLDGASPNSPALYLQINLYAHQRFPQNLTFVRNLLGAYRAKATYNEAAYNDLLRAYWFADAGLQTSYFEHLSQSGQLRRLLAALPPLARATQDSNLAAVEFHAYGHAWLTQYEEAAPAFARLAEWIPGDRGGTGEAMAIERSLGASDRTAFDAAVKFAEQDVKTAPAERGPLTTVGEIYADKERYAEARPWWDRVAALQPGVSGGYLDAATIFWDYFQFDDALHVIAGARRSLHAPAEFSYEQGAIYESQGKPRQAIAAYIQGALRAGSAEAKNRLLTLAGRKATAGLVEQETAGLVNSSFDANAFELRLAVLEKENRRPAMEALLTAGLKDSKRANDLASVREAAQRLGFNALAASAMQRVIAMTADPIEKLQAQIELGHFYESHSDQAGAEREFSAALATNPDRLGVVRAAVDYYWRSKQSGRAVQTLVAAADRAQPPFGVELRREAASKASDAGEYDRARALLDQLLANDPWNGDLLAAKARSYAQQNDTAGLITFYSSELAGMKSATLPAEEKTSRMAALRRGYIAALIAVAKYTDALEQYQLVINAYPEDTALIAEASRFAGDHQLVDHLVAYYTKAVSDAPRDYRWPLVLARIDTELRRYLDAIAAYGKAGVVRPDRPDIFTAKADLQVRLLRFDDALQTYAKLYDLSYHDTQYLAAQATLEQRLNRPAEAFTLLHRAYIDPHPHETAGYLAGMRQEIEWRNFEAADRLFQEGRDLFTYDDSNTAEAIRLEAQALSSLHRPVDAIELAAATLPPKASSSGVAEAIGAAAGAYLTPPEKNKLASYLLQMAVRPRVSGQQIAAAAKLADVQARLEWQAILASGPSRKSGWYALDRLQTSRLAFAELGRQLEQIAQRAGGPERADTILRGAFRAYKQGGDAAAEQRLIQYSGADFARIFLESGRSLDASLTREESELVITYLLTHGSAEQITRAIEARGRSLTPLWTHGYLALAGLYLLSPAPQTPQAFEAVLGPRTVGGELSNRAPADSLRGEDWFYYAARFGEYLGYGRQARAADLLPATIENNGAASDNYVALAETYLDLKNTAAAARLLRDALQISPRRADVYDKLAGLSMEQHRTNEAVDLWRQGFDLLAARVEEGRLPESYWPTARSLLRHMNRFDLVTELKPAADHMLRMYAHRNGVYRFAELLRGLFEENADTNGAVQWVIALSQLPDMPELLSEARSAPWIPEGAKQPVFEAELAGRRRALAEARGQQVDEARQTLRASQTSYAAYLQNERRWAEEWSTLQQIEPPEDRPANQLLVAAAMTGHLDELLASYGAKPESAPAGTEILSAAAILDTEKRPGAALSLKQFEYTRQLRAGTADPSAWFGLAQVRFAQKRNPEGLQLIRDVTLSVGEPFANLPEAVRVLEASGLQSDAGQYAREWSTAEPWNSEARLTWARLGADNKILESVRTAPQVEYRLRVEAAGLLRDQAASVDGTDELALLTHKTIPAAEASQPYFVEARLAAARQSRQAAEQIRLCREIVALDPSVQAARVTLAEAAFHAGEKRLGLIAFRSYENTSEATQESTEMLAVKELAADALVSEQEYQQAIPLLSQLIAKTSDRSRRKPLEDKLANAKRNAELAEANFRRRPVVTETIRQKQIVRPRLTAWTPDLRGPQGSGEGEEQR